MATYNLFVDSDTKRIVSGFLSSQQAQQQQFVFGDKARVAVTVVTQNNGGDFADRPWRLIDMSDKRIDVAIRAAQKTPTVGNFKILASDDIAYNATADEVEVALNADATISGEGGVTVSSIEDSTSYNVTYNTTGTKTELSQTFNDLLPSSGIYIDTIREGDASTTKVVQIRTEVLPASYAQLSDTITQPQVVIEQIRNGGGGDAGEVQRVFVDSEPYSGTYALLVDGSPTGEIAYNDTQNEVTTALAKLPLIGGDESLITVNGDAEDFTVTFDPSLGDLSNIVVDSVNLTGLNGKQGDLDLNTIEMTQILAGEESVSGTLEIVLHDTLTSSDETIYQDNCSILEDVIGSSPPSVTPIKEYADAQHTHVIADVDGLQDELDDLSADVSGIAQNTSDIAQNTSDISQNASDIAQNTSDISQNTSDISQNTSDIAQNASDIASLSALPGVKAFCVFDGTLTGTNPPISGYNVTSVTRVEQGRYDVTLTNAAPAEPFVVTASGTVSGSNVNISMGATSSTTTTFRVQREISNGSTSDSTKISAVAFW